MESDSTGEQAKSGDNYKKRVGEANIRMTELEEREQETKKRRESEKSNANVVMFRMGGKE